MLCPLSRSLFAGCAVPDALPWGPVDPRWIRQAVESGQALTADQSIPQPYYQLVRAGLQPNAQDRSSSLQDLRYLLRCDIRVPAACARAPGLLLVQQPGGWICHITDMLIVFGSFTVEKSVLTSVLAV